MNDGHQWPTRYLAWRDKYAILANYSDKILQYALFPGHTNGSFKVQAFSMSKLGEDRQI